MDRKIKVLIVDDEQGIRTACERMLPSNAYEISTAENGKQAVILAETNNPDVVLLDVVLPDCSGIDLIAPIKTKQPDAEIVIMTAFGSIDMAIKALKNGAYDFLTKPFSDQEALLHSLNKAYEKKTLVEKTRKLENQLFDRYSFSNIIGSSRAMKNVFSNIKDVAYSSTTILVQGESGTGKELVAKAIHYNSPRKEKELIAFNCSALTSSLIDSELFGHVKGSFTGALSDKIGLFEAANNSTIFLDEVGDMPSDTQVRFLRVLEEGEIKSVGSALSKKVNVRVIAATNRNLKKLVEERKFREDLYYRLSVIVIDLPALRERKDDIPVLAYYFLKKYNEKNGKNIQHIAPEVMKILENHEWRGNVRELENVMERAVVISRGPAIKLTDMPAHIIPERITVESIRKAPSCDFDGLSFKEAKNRVIESFAKNYFSEILREAQGNISKAAEKAEIERSNFKKLLKKHNLTVEAIKATES